MTLNPSQDSWAYQVPSFTYRAKVRLATHFLKKRTSAPYLTQDALKLLCDISINDSSELKEIDLSKLKSARTVYINSAILRDLLSDFPTDFLPRVIISGGSDEDFFELPGKLPVSTNLLLLQNSHISDSRRIFTLPIGIENLSLGMNGYARYMRQRVPWCEKKDSCLVGPFGLTHEDRFLIRDSLGTTSDKFYIAQRRMSPSKFSKFANQFKFTLAMRGNGEDTHRFWETLYRGSLPIVKRSSWADSLKSFKLPFLEVNEWNELEVLSEMNAFRQNPISPRELEYLWIPTWKKFIANHI